VPFWFGPRQLNQPVGAAFKGEWKRKKPNRLNKTGIFSFILYHGKQPNMATTSLALDHGQQLCTATTSLAAKSARQGPGHYWLPRMAPV
jgi:hypothetical protein